MVKDEFGIIKRNQSFFWGNNKLETDFKLTRDLTLLFLEENKSEYIKDKTVNYRIDNREITSPVLGPSI